jgi:hypothetical protein
VVQSQEVIEPPRECVGSRNLTVAALPASNRYTKGECEAFKR